MIKHVLLYTGIVLSVSNAAYASDNEYQDPPQAHMPFNLVLDMQPGVMQKLPDVGKDLLVSLESPGSDLNLGYKALLMTQPLPKYVGEDFLSLNTVLMQPQLSKFDLDPQLSKIDLAGIQLHERVLDLQLSKIDLAGIQLHERVLDLQLPKIDLAGIQPPMLDLHLKKNGLGNGGNAAGNMGTPVSASLPTDFDPKTYLRLNPDLKKSTKKLKKSSTKRTWLIAHYINHGIGEKRRYK